MKIYEWNIGMAATIPSNNGYDLKSWVIEEIVEDKPDVIVLTEFVVSRGIDYFFKALDQNNYCWFISTYTGQNGILIALKKSIFGFDDVFGYKMGTLNNFEILKCKYPPDFYEIQVRYNERRLSIIGLRVRKYLLNEEDSNYIQPQFEAIDTYLSSLNHDVICIGDFNAYWGERWDTKENKRLPETAKHYTLYTPNYHKYYSYVMPDGEKVGLDHLVTNIKNKCIKCEYDWSFINESRYKKNIRKESYEKISGSPDHAILKVEMEL